MTWFALVPLAVLIALFVGMTYYVFKIMQWQDIMTYEKYLIAYPDHQTDTGIRCFSCSKDKVVEQGLWSAKSRERVFVCSHCDTTLYRSDD